MGSTLTEAHPSLTTDLMIFVISLSFCALTAFLETSITTLRLFKLKELAESTGRYKPLLALLEKHNHRVLTTILIAKNLADVAAATFGAGLTARLFDPLPDTFALWLGITLVTLFILLFGEIIPKIIAKLYGERLFASTLGLINVIYYLLYPIVNLCIPLAQQLTKKFIGELPLDETSIPITSEKEIRFLIDYIAEHGGMEHEKTLMLQSVFALGSTQVKDIMVPSGSIISLTVNTSIAEAFDLFIRHQYSRMPIYEDHQDNVIGMIYLKDIFPLMAVGVQQRKSLRDIIRPILFVPESMRVTQLLKEFKLKSMHIALVINEHGTLIGLVTLEDILEEIVGEIRDEYESVSSKIITLKPDSWLIDASVELKNLGTELNISFESEGAHTLSGFLNERFQNLPKKGDRLRYKQYCFQVQQAGAKRVMQVLAYKDKISTLDNNIYVS